MYISKIYCNRIISAIMLISMLLGIGYGVGCFLRPFHYSTDIYNKGYDELKERNRDIDMVLIGASQVLVGFDPKTFEHKLGFEKVFNPSIPQQSMLGIYYQLKEFIADFHPSYVVIGITEGMLQQKSTPIITKLRMLEILHGINGLMYIKDAFSMKDYPYLYPIFSYRNNLSKIESNMQAKRQFKREGLYMRTSRWHAMGNGFVAYPKGVLQGNIGIQSLTTFEESNITDNERYYLDKCIELCKDNNIQVILMLPPTSMSQIYSIKNFQAFVDYITDYAQKKKIPFHNLSYLKEREVFLPDSMMSNYKHLNKAGAAIISEKYADILGKYLQGINTNEYFYTSIDEMKRSVDRIVAVDSKPVIKNNNVKFSVQSLQNADITPCYQVLLAEKGDEFKIVCDWTSCKNLTFKIQKGCPCRILLRAREKDNATSYAWMAWEISNKGKAKKTENIPEYLYKF